MFFSTKILQDIGLNLNAAASSAWLSGGSIGSRNAVLVFKTSVLKRHIYDDDDDDLDSDDSQNPTTSSTEKCRFPPVMDTKITTSTSHESVKRLIAPTFDINRKSNGKPSISVSSSSENSISSACEDPSDLEADIVKAEKLNSNEKRSIGQMVVDRIKSRFGTREDGDHEAKTDHEQTIDDADADVDADADAFAVDAMPAAILKMTYKFMNTETKLLKRILFSHGLEEARECQKFNLLWTGLHMKPDILRSLLPFQRVNHFPR